MIKNNKVKLIISSLIILLPTVFGLIFWETLQEQMQKNFNTRGTGTLLLAVLMPLFIFVLNIFCVTFTGRDQEGREQSKKIIGMVFWICPIISIFCGGVFFFIIFNLEVNFVKVLFAMIGIGFIVMGNYMPKVRQNRTFGIKVKWTLANKQNWERTHRFAGKLWFFGGLLTLFFMFVPLSAVVYVVFGICVAMVVPPVIYSYVFYKKQIKSGEETVESYEYKGNKKRSAAVIASIAVICMVITVLLFTGSIEAKIGENSITLDCAFWDKAEISFEDIKSIELRDNIKSSIKFNGINSAKICCGYFDSTEIGNHIRYTYTGQEKCILIKTETNMFVVALESTKQTEALYIELFTKMFGEQ